MLPLGLAPSALGPLQRALILRVAVGDGLVEEPGHSVQVARLTRKTSDLSKVWNFIRAPKSVYPTRLRCVFSAPKSAQMELIPSRKRPDVS